jgi:hemoglobin
MPRSIPVLLLLLMAAPVFGEEAETQTETAPPPTPDEMVAVFEARCAETAEARAARQEEAPLYERLGGSEGILAATQEVIRLHMQNDAIQYLFADLDTAHVARQVANFLIAGTGGPDVYEGVGLTASHKEMHLTNAEFMAAGADVVQAMKNLGAGESEIEETMCMFMALRDQVVLPQEDEAPAEEPTPDEK